MISITKKSLLGAVASLLLCGIASGLDLAELWKDGKLWELPRKSSDELSMKDVDDESSVCQAGSFSFGEMELGETTLTWYVKDAEQQEKEESAKEDKKPEGEDKAKAQKPTALMRITCIVYSRGDDGSMDVKEFTAKLNSCTNELNAFFGKKAKKIALPEKNTGLKVQALLWENENGAIRIESAIQNAVDKDDGKKKKRPEFIRLVCAENKKLLDKGGAGDKSSRRDLKENVETESDGTVWIKNIPMVDQGGRGYCVPATVARVFAYYGMDGVDMTALAALCDSDADGGTSTSAMVSALKSIGGRFRVKIKPLFTPSGNHVDFIRAYNKEARAKNKTELEEQDSTNISDDWYADINGEIWAQVRAKKQSDVKKLMSVVRKNIDAGFPVLWSVFASGLYNHEQPAEKSDPGGAHMRMIIGYNLKKNQIIYSDSWGSWAARRVMTAPEAYSVTTHVYVLQP